MPAPSKRRAEALEPTRTSKRNRPSTTQVSEETQDTTKSPTGRLRRTKAIAKVEAKDGTEIIAKVEKEEPEEKSQRKKRGKPTVKAQVEVHDHEEDKVETAVAKKVRGRKEKVEVKGATGATTGIKHDPDEDSEPLPRPSKSKRKTKSEKEGVADEGTEATGEVIEKPTKRKRKTKEEKEAEMVPLAARSKDLRMFVGAHVSAAGGVHNSVTNANHIGGNSFALFLKSQRKWDNPALQDEHKDTFWSHCSTHGYKAHEHVLPHGSYLVNLAQAEPDKAKQAYDSFIDDLQRCEALGIRYYNFHPGNTNSNPRPEAIGRISDAINRAHAATKTVTPVLENMAGAGNVIGSAFEDLRDIIEGVKDKNRVGVCLDTCHAFAAGYDLRSVDAFRATMDSFDRTVGMKYLRALHVNDSKAPFNSRRDLHQNIGLGFLGLRAFHNIMNEARFEGLPLVLETPIDRKDSKTGKTVENKQIWADEIKMLESLIGMDANTDEFRKLEQDLAEKGKEERARIQDQVDRKVEKEVKKAGAKGGRKKKGKAVETDEELSELSASES
jgi:AP endonuclease-1